MGSDFLEGVGSLALAFPFLAITAFLLYDCIRRAVPLRKARRRASHRAFFLPSAALSTVLLLAQTFYRPSIAYLVEIRQELPPEEEDASDPETTARQLSRQLKRIRRGESVDRLVVRP